MKLSLKRYSFILFFQFSFLFIDLLLNSFAYLARGDKLSIIFVFLAQDICLILAFTTLIFSMYSTYIYQAGVAELLYKKFRLPLIVLTIYFMLCVGYHVFSVMSHDKSPYSFQWPAGLTALFILQRLFSPVYYYLYKRSALRMSDPRFYENMDWVAEQLAIK
ncbi:transmembrane protein 138 [Condylostylus longicornis]|uniref:transmembrane protein 138 n=1 Tax=Condylostylus longicornis TaxID=2530218 RepID=UPI00244E1449|nr:transmembrane protein 138 [Condylostylus longicornis]